MTMTLLYTKKIYHLTAVILLSVMIGLPLVSMADTSSGWYSFRTEYLGGASGCPAGFTQMDIAIKDADSFLDINPAGVRIKLQVFNMQNLLQPFFVRENQWAENSTLSNSICYDSHREGVRPVIEVSPSSSYRPHRQEMIVGSLSGIDAGHRLRGYAHLLPKQYSDPETVRTIEPREQIINQDPGYRVGIRSLPEQYNDPQNMSMDGLATSLLYVWHHQDQLWSRYQFSTPGGAHSSRVLPPRDLAQDGYYLWTVSHSLNSLITLGGSGQGYWVNWSNTIISGTTHPYTNFLLDRQPPTTEVTLEVGETSSTGSQEFSIRNTARDTVSGLVQMDVFISNADIGEVRVARETFSVGAGLTGGTKNTQEITVDVQVPSGQSYEIFARAVDAAGNVAESNSIEYTAPEVPTELPDLTIYSGPRIADLDVYDFGSEHYETVDFGFAITNIGSGAVDTQADSIDWFIEIDAVDTDMSSSGTGTASALGSGDVEAVSFPVSDVPYGEYEVFVHVDPDDEIAEENTENNTVGPVRLTVPPPDPDVSLRLEQSVLRSGQQGILYWQRDPEYPIECTLEGPGLLEDPEDPDSVTIRITYSVSEASGIVVTTPRFNTSQYRFYCAAEGESAFVFDESVRLEVIASPFEL